MRLFELVGQYKALQALEESDDLPPEVIADTLEGIEGDIETKCANIAKFVLSLKANREAIEEASKAMALRASRIEKTENSIKHYMLLMLQMTNIKSIKTPEITVRRQNSPPSVVISDGVEVPEEFMFQPLAPPAYPDKKALKEALQSGREIPGVFVEAGEHIRIAI
jgi:hypothetical protein